MKNLLRENRSLLLFLLLMFVFRSVVADWNTVPTGSMKPTILEGDRILVDRMAYDLRIPFTHVSLLRTGEPRRGDIVVFDSAASDKRLVKRVIGLPGDVVELRDNRLIVNGEVARYRPVSTTAEFIDLVESLGGLRHPVRLQRAASLSFASFGPLRIPEDAYLVLGDNRDRSADSRVIGLVPRRELLGRASRVIVSLNPDNFYLPRGDRWLKEL